MNLPKSSPPPIYGPGPPRKAAPAPASSTPRMLGKSSPARWLELNAKLAESERDVVRRNPSGPRHA